MQLCCLHNYWYYELIRLLLCKITISSTDLYVSSLQLPLCKGRSLQFRTILSVHVAPIIPEDSSMVHFKFFPSSMVFTFRGKARLPLYSDSTEPPYDTAGFTLCYDLYFCSHSLEHFVTTLYTYNFLYAQWIAKRLLDDYLYWTFTS